MRLWKSKICMALKRTWIITCCWSWVARSSGGTLSGRHIYNLFLFLFRFWDWWRSVKQQKVIPKRRESTSYHCRSKYDCKVACTHPVLCFQSCHLNIWWSEHSPQPHPKFPSCHLSKTTTLKTPLPDVEGLPSGSLCSREETWPTVFTNISQRGQKPFYYQLDPSHLDSFCISTIYRL